MADYDSRLRRLESRVIASDDDGKEFSELIRKRTADLLGNLSPEERAALDAPNPEFDAWWQAYTARLMSAQGKR